MQFILMLLYLHGFYFEMTQEIGEMKEIVSVVITLQNKSLHYVFKI